MSLSNMMETKEDAKGHTMGKNFYSPPDQHEKAPEIIFEFADVPPGEGSLTAKLQKEVTAILVNELYDQMHQKGWLT